LPVDWPGFITSVVMALIGGPALFFIEPALKRKK
jgi:hypothetical protein